MSWEIFEQIIQFCTNNIFSIVMCILLFWKMDKQDKDHKEETEKLTQALQNNTVALQQLIDKLS